jgi:hypothetical protein
LLGGFAEDDRVELFDSRDFSLVGHQAFRDRVDGVEDDELGDTSAACRAPSV